MLSPQTAHIAYDDLVCDALRGVVRNVMRDLATTGVLPGDHYFYISFATQAEGVGMSLRLRQQYPDEMTIIIQHQFEGCCADDESFSIQLAFGGISETICVPFMAIKAFCDPSVSFVLRFAPATADATAHTDSVISATPPSDLHHDKMADATASADTLAFPSKAARRRRSSGHTSPQQQQSHAEIISLNRPRDA